MTIIDQERRLEFDMWYVQSIGSGRIVFGGGGVTPIDGNGLSSGAVAAGWGSLAGLIRGDELRAGRIDHMLFASTNCVSGTVAPAVGNTTLCSSKGISNTDAPKLGQVLKLAYSDAEIDALNVPAWKKAIARAAARYGIIIGDHGSGGRSLAFHFESGNTYESFGTEDRMVTFAKAAGLSGWFDSDIGKTTYRMDMASGIDWSRLRVLDPNYLS
jgi:hypothetical protein